MIELIDKIKPKNNGDFALMDAADVEMPDGTRLDDHDFLDSSELTDAINEALAQAKESGKFDGKDGLDGRTPQKGEDYYTEEDKTEMVNAVISALPTWTGGSY